MFPYGFWENDLWKEAARAGLRQISKLVGQGNLSRASSLATTPGVLKPSAAGSQLRHLGSGSEGLATLVAHPEHGVAVRKLYDPHGLSTPSMIARKEEVGRALGNNPNFSNFLGSAPTPNGGGTMHFNEYVPSKGPTPVMGNANPQQRAMADTTGRNAQTALAQHGYEGHDIRMGNMITDARTGQNKVIDYLPAKPGEMMSDPKNPHSIKVNREGEHLFNSHALESDRNSLLSNSLGSNVGKVRAQGTSPSSIKPSTSTDSPTSAIKPPTPLASPATMVGKKKRPFAPPAPVTPQIPSI